MSEVYKALANFRASVNIEKSGINTYHNNSRYHTIDDIMSGLQRCDEFGIGWHQCFDGNDLITTIVHLESGESIQSRVYIGDYNEAQKWAGAVTYKRRISLVTMFGLSEPDADGNETINTPAKQSNPKPAAIDYDYSDAPYRIFSDGSSRPKAEFTDVKAWGQALKKAVQADTHGRVSKANLDEVNRVLRDVDKGMHHKTREALTKSLLALKEEMTKNV